MSFKQFQWPGAFFRSCRKVKPLMNTEIMHIFFLLLYSYILLFLSRSRLTSKLSCAPRCYCLYVLCICANVCIYFCEYDFCGIVNVNHGRVRQKICRPHFKRSDGKSCETKTKMTGSITLARKRDKKQVALNLYTKLLFSLTLSIVLKIIIKI